jgi:hypothetical protein
MDAINQQNKPTPKPVLPSKSGRKNSETRGSEERGMGGAPSKKRGRDLDTERVSAQLHSPDVHSSLNVQHVLGVTQDKLVSQPQKSRQQMPKAFQGKNVDTPPSVKSTNAISSRCRKSSVAGRHDVTRQLVHVPSFLSQRMANMWSNVLPLQEDQYNSKPAIRIPVNDTLKSILVDDWENITKNLQLVSLPSSTPVNKILQDYMEHEVKRRKAEDPHRDVDSDSPHAELLEEVVAGLREYFNRALGRILLYRYERGQYEDMLARLNSSTDALGGKQISDVYGAEHFLRLFGKFLALT